MTLCEICEDADAVRVLDPYDDLGLCALCRFDLDEQRALGPGGAPSGPAPPGPVN
jgi:hypothetical protein